MVNTATMWKRVNPLTLVNSWRNASVLMLTLLCCMPMAYGQEEQRWHINMTDGVTPVSQTQYDLHMLIFWICVAIGVLVFGALFFTMYFHRKSLGHKAATFHESIALEVAWTVVPFIILIAMAFPATQAVINQYDTEENVDVDVVVTGFQWKWKYDYLGTDVSFFSNLHPDHNNARQLHSGVDVSTIENYLLEVDEPLVLPVEKKIRFLVTASDVLHAWWVPALGVKRDAIPGFVREAWAYIEEPGIYRGQCAELCGRDHGFMPIVVKAVPYDEYTTWLNEKQQQAAALAALANQTFTTEELIERGRDVYARTCSACHGPNGDGVPGAFPSLRTSPVVTGPLENHLNIVLDGVPGTAMQAFGEQLSPVDIAAVITFKRMTWGNGDEASDVIQPIDVLQANQ